MGVMDLLLKLIVIYSMGTSPIATPVQESGFRSFQDISPQPGLDLAKMEVLRRTLDERRTKNFLVLHRGKIAFEWYSAESGPEKRHYTASLAKSIVGGGSLMLALEMGRIAVDDPACRYIPSWRGHPLKSKITIRHLATHSSGLEDAEIGELPHSELPGWKGAFWRREPDPFTVALRDAPVMFAPGSSYAYSNTGMAALAFAVTASLKGSTYPDIRSLLENRILTPLGIPAEDWSIGYGRNYAVDGLELYGNWGGGSFTARAVAKLGLLMLQRGNWNGKQLVDPAWVDRVKRFAGTAIPDRTGGNPAPSSALCWWTNFDGVWPRLPHDAFAGAGAGQQLLLVVPSLDLVVVRNGGNLSDPSEKMTYWEGAEKFVFNPVIEALPASDSAAGEGSRGPYPPSPVIKGLKFEESEKIIRGAEGSDNWPLTWTADDWLFGAYGDGWGFRPKVSEKLSLGFAKISGTPSHYTAFNVRSDSGEQIGQGERGRKASGMLAVGDRLYMWVRNAGNSQLAWSDDGGETWEWSSWRFTESFGHPCFLNFGKAYAGARDQYVYVYSHDQDSAYEIADQMVLARVPVDQILKREAYEFFAAFVDGQPGWSRNIEERGPVFVHPGRCYRSSVSYNEPLKRYLWVQVHPGESPRYFGGFGIYDAPEPWGPWTTAFYTESWDVGPGENAHLPTKWISDDGKTLHLVFSGDDSFSVRKAEVILKGEQRKK